ncbi:MAG: insulinase family protein [Gammaproteobacteria bacterium]|nr:insulinase family protein [Gammaproteobacteria bacterium]
MTYKTLTTVVFAILLVAGCGNDAAPPANEAGSGFAIEYEKYTLDNGMDVILHVDRSDPVVAVASIFHVGSNREVVGRTGFAHFFEHMSFNDSENVPRGANRKYIGELGGSRNGGTSFDYTQYYEIVPKDAMEKIFWIDSDRMGYMINTVTEEALEREKQVVKNEKRQNYDNRPYGFNISVILENLFPEGHPYSWPVIGSLEDLQNATLEDVKEFYDRWYGANNATLAIAGDFDPEEIKPKIEQWFGEIRRGPDTKPMQPIPVVLEETRNVWHPDGFARLPQLTRVYPSVELYHPDSYALQVLGQVLAGSKTAPLHKVIVEERELAPAVSVDNSPFEVAGMLFVSVRALQGVALDDVVAGIDEGMARFAENGVSESELTRIKTELETAFYQDLSGVLNKALGLASYNEFAGDPGFATENLRRLQAVTRDDVMRVFEKYVQGEHFVQTSFVPKASPELAVSGAELARVTEEVIVQGAETEVSQGALAEYEKTPSKYDRSEPPLGELPVFRSPEIWSRSLANGIEVLGIEDNELPLVTFNLVLPGGGWLDERPGTASLLAGLFTQGTAGKTPAQLEEAIGLQGADISVHATAEAFTISVDTLERNLEATVALVEEMLLEPRWDSVEFERLRSATEATIIAEEGDAGSVASNVWRRVVYGDNHPFGRPSAGTRDAIAAMTLDDLKDWYTMNMTPGGARLQVVGAVDGDRIAKAFAGLSKRWTGDPVAMPEYELASPPKGQSVYFVDIPGAKQSVIDVGKRVVPATDPEWVRLNYASQRLGGGSSARLFQLLRIEKGYTYGAGTYVGENAKDAAPWLAYTSVRANVTLESMELMREQINNYAPTFTDEDANVTKNQVIKRNARAYETPESKIRLLDRIALQGLPHDVVEQETAVLQSMSTADFHAAITEHMDESEMVWVIVGDGETQRERLKDFGYGEPIELDRRGDVIAAAPSSGP